MIYNVLGNGQVQLEPVCAQSVEVYGVNGFSDSEFIWSVEGGTVIEGDGTDTVIIEWGYETGVRMIEVLEVTSENCSNYPSLAQVEVRAPFVDLGYDYPEICDSDTLIFEAGSNYQEPYEILWHDGSTGNEYIATQTEEIWIRIVDGYGCTRYDTVSLLVHQLPDIDLGNDTVLCDDMNPMYLDAGDFATYQWITSRDNYYYNPIDIYPAAFLPDTVRITATDYNGCIARDTMVVFPCDLEVLFRDMANTITPNGDGDNDTWNIPYMEIFENAVLEIFDRWGRLVYRTEKVYEEPWDGTSRGRDLPMDSYYYVIELNTGNAKPVVGTVNIIR